MTDQEFKCPRCGGTIAEPGAVQFRDTALWKFNFVPSHRLLQYRLFRSPHMGVSAEVCVRCGHVEFTADVTKLESITGRKYPR